MIDNKITRIFLVVILSLMLIPGTAFALDQGETPEDDLGGGTTPGTGYVDTSSGSNVKKQSNPLMLGISKKTYKRSKLKKTRSFKINAKGEGAITYKRDAKAKKAKIKVSKSGKVTVPKKCKKGRYAITVEAVGNDRFEPGSDTVMIRIK